MSLCRVTFKHSGFETFMLTTPDGVYLLNRRAMKWVKCNKISKQFYTSGMRSI